MGYVDLNNLHNPATSAFVPAAWGHQLRDNDWWLAHRPHAHAYNASAQAISTITTTDLSFNSERRDNAGIHSIVSDREKFYLKDAGQWLLWCAGYFEPNTTGVRILSLTINDYVYPFGDFNGAPDSTSNGFVSCRVRMVCQAGAEVRWTVYQNSGGNLDATFEAGCVLLEVT